MNQTVKRVLVLGGGSAGLLAALSLKVKLPQLEVVVVRSKEIGTIMVGEGTTDSVPVYLHGYLGIDPAWFHRDVQPTWKMGIRFLWGPRDHFNYTFSRQVDAQYEVLPRPHGFYCDEVFDYTDINGAMMEHDRIFERTPDGSPHIGKNVAYHMENAKLVEFLESYSAKTGITIIDGTVAAVEQDAGGVRAIRLESGNKEAADLFVDCSGFRAVLLHGALDEPFVSFDSTLLCDRAVTAGWQRTDEPIKPYTTSETMHSGWAWQIEHEHLINRGYVYSSAFISDEDAEREFCDKNPRLGDTRLVKFVTGRYRNLWVKNVVSIGNASGFVEPLQSTSLATICEQCDSLVKTLVEGKMTIRPTQVKYYNRRVNFIWDSVRKFLAVNYHFNTRVDSPFWHACCNDLDLAGAEELVEYYRENGPSIAWNAFLVSPFDPVGYEGYLTMIVGQKVPYANRYHASQQEWQFWNAVRAQLCGRANQAMTVREVLDMTRGPGWSWNADFYKRVAHW